MVEVFTVVVMLILWVLWQCIITSCRQDKAYRNHKKIMEDRKDKGIK